jgi:hypothetical protein
VMRFPKVGRFLNFEGSVFGKGLEVRSGGGDCGIGSIARIVRRIMMVLMLRYLAVWTNPMTVRLLNVGRKICRLASSLSDSRSCNNDDQ